MVVDPGAEDLVGAQAQRVQDDGVDLVHGTPRSLGDDRVQQSLHAQGAVGQLGGEGGVTAVDLLLAQCGGQGDIGEGGVCGDLAQHLEDDVADPVTGADAAPGVLVLPAVRLTAALVALAAAAAAAALTLPVVLSLVVTLVVSLVAGAGASGLGP